jgi:histidyl-tRNA synthetase
LWAPASEAKQIKIGLKISLVGDDPFHLVYFMNISNNGHVERFSYFSEGLQSLGYSVEYDPSLVRGLAYYTGLIYEYKAIDGNVRVSIGGGGRYDNLSVIYGGPGEYFTGLALGLDRVIAVLSGVKVGFKPLVAIVGLKGSSPGGLLKIKRLLEEHGIPATLVYSGRIGRGLSYASRIGVDYAVIIGRREEEAGKATVKNMLTGEQYSVKADLVPFLIIRDILQCSGK